MRYYEILLEDYKTSAKKFIDSGFSPDLVKSVLLQFRQIQPRISDINLKNIDWWARNRTFPQLKNYIENFEGIPTKSQMGKKTGRSHNLIENSEWLIVIPLDKDASCFHGKTTDWCTTKPFQNYYEDYFYDNRITLIYCLQKNSGKKWAIAAHNKFLDSTEFFDVNDKPLSYEEFEKQTGLNVDEILHIAFGTEVQKNVETSRVDYSVALKRIKQLIKEIEQTNKPNSEIESLLWYTKHKGLLQAYMSLVGPADFNKNLEIFAINSIDNAITYIAHPSERIQLMSAKRDGFTTLNYLMQLIGEDSISEEVKRACVYENPSIINRINDQSEELKRIAIERGLWNLKFLKPPVSDELKMMAIKNDGRAIDYIQNPSEEMQIESLSQYGDRINLILKKGIKPSEKVLLTSVSRQDADEALNVLIGYNVEITDKILTTAMKNSDDPKAVIGVASMNNIEISIGAQIAAVNNIPHAIYSLYALYNGKVNEAVQIVAAREGGASFIAETYRYIVTTRKLIDVSRNAIEEAFKHTAYLSVKQMKNMITLKSRYGEEFSSFPTYETFKNAIDSVVSVEINSDVIELLSMSFVYPDIHEKLVNYAKDVAKQEKQRDNAMLGILVSDYIRQSDLENLSFEPEEK